MRIIEKVFFSELTSCSTAPQNEAGRTRTYASDKWADALTTKLIKVFNATLKSVDRRHLLLYFIKYNSNQKSSLSALPVIERQKAESVLFNRFRYFALRRLDSLLNQFKYPLIICIFTLTFVTTIVEDTILY